MHDEPKTVMVFRPIRDSTASKCLLIKNARKTKKHMPHISPFLPPLSFYSFEMFETIEKKTFSKNHKKTYHPDKHRYVLDVLLTFFIYNIYVFSPSE